MICHRRSRARGAACLVAVAVTLSACTADGRTPTGTDGVVEVIAAEDRQRVEPFTGELLDGGRFDTTSLAGKVVVYNVWGSWCAPCRTEAPVLKQVSEETRKLGVRFVGINVRDNDAAARAFEDNYGIEYPSITTDTSTDAMLAFGTALPPSAVPSTLVVDAQGRLAARIVGPTGYSTLSTIVTETAAESDPGQ
ncbi:MULTISPECIES: TlpA family protein disulfide reductase [unclassified Nocardioides]|uniref:TlpA family protein disulfide reductase n=1 Tax=unclassified Nocardioides TaxID=2615069 RepID=UPI0009F07ADF|nr:MULTISPECIES: TlpA disulfide reductase family protein [unclassified Nocardioides]GAW49732.1 redoxin domain-containing protein [Nocardioides sp. PD653-B2]GAW56528.1 redoxin domain-containing protein [Nocardioides sp. PD653]